MSLKTQLSETIKTAMKNKEKEKLTTLRMFSAAIKQREVDERVELDNDECIKVLTVMIKQRKEAFKQYEEAGRSDLAEKEVSEIKILETFLPEQLSEEDLRKLIDKAITETEATSMKDMGQVMNILRPEIQGKADPAYVSSLIKARLQGA